MTCKLQRRLVAYCVTPHTGGTFRFYLNLRQALAAHNWDVLAVSCAHIEREMWWEERLWDAGCVHIAPKRRSLGEAVAEFVNWVEKNNVRIVFPMCSPVAWASLPYLPSFTNVITRLSSTSKWSIRIATCAADRLSAIVAMTPYHAELLSRRSPQIKRVIRVIPQGVNTDVFFASEDHNILPNNTIHLVYLGRLSRYDKGTDLLPKICRRLKRNNIQFRLSIIGDGEYSRALERELVKSALCDVVTLLGPRRPEEIPQLLRGQHVLLLTSRFEGFPNALLEGMASGLVPIATLLPGITDYILDHGRAGILCNIGDDVAFADAIITLSRNPHLHASMRSHGQSLVRARFDLKTCGQGYATLFASVCSQQVNWKSTPLPELSRINYHPCLRPRAFVSLRRFLRSRINTLRLLLRS